MSRSFGRRNIAAVLACLIVLLGLGIVVRFVQLRSFPMPATIGDAVSQFGSPLCEADAVLVEPLTGGKTNVPLQVRLVGVRPVGDTTMYNGASDNSTPRIIVFSSSQDVRGIIEEFLTEDVPAGRTVRPASFFPRAKLELLTVSSAGRVLSHESLEKPHILLVAPESAGN